MSKRCFPPPSLPAAQKWPLSPPKPSLKILEPETRNCQRKRKTIYLLTLEVADG